MSLDDPLHPARRHPSRLPLLLLRFIATALVMTSGGLGGLSTARASAAPAVPSPLPAPSRVQGVDRYDQAVKAAATFSAASIVYVASGEKFADALSSAAVAAHHGSPLLLTPRDAIPDTVLAELARLRPATIVIVGGEASVSEAVAEQVSQRVIGSTVVRIAGADRYEVSRNLLADPAVGAIRAATVFAVTGANFPDALTASPAAAHHGSSPVLLVDGSVRSVSAAEVDVLHGLGALAVRLVGGENSLSVPLEASLGERFQVTRSAGADRFEAGVAVNHAVFASATRVYLASGVSFPDALSGGPLAAHFDAPLYVVQPNCVPGSVLAELDRLHPAEIVILGGPNTLGPGVDALARC